MQVTKHAHASTSRKPIESVKLLVAKQVNQLPALFQQGQYEAVKTLALQITVQSPKQAQAWKLLGIAEHQQGEYQPAVNALKQAVKLTPKVAKARYNCVNGFFDNHQCKELKNYYQHDVKLAPHP